jgi:HD-GYP domain-containing protein (c-di-GMP phosphodiesterase class II)
MLEDRDSPATELADFSALFARMRSALGNLLIHRPHPAIILVNHEASSIFITPVSVWLGSPEIFAHFRETFDVGTAGTVLVGKIDAEVLRDGSVLGSLRLDATEAELQLTVERALDWLTLRARQAKGSASLVRYEYEFSELSEIARSLTTERDIERLLGLILEKSRMVTGADAGSLYVVEGLEGGTEPRRLHFKLSQNDSVHFDWREFTMPVSRNSMAGWVALERQTIRIEDAYQRTPGVSFGFDRSFDERTGYRTKSMICAPLTNNRGEVLGVLQLINKKHSASQRLLNSSDVERYVVPFDGRSEQLLLAVAAQAGIALENALLYDEIRGLFDGFVRASVDAIESRDPTTSGHSRRVATLTLGLARAVESCGSGAYAGVRWQGEDLRELEYASLLHDFGKIGVKERVLTKAKKLYAFELERIRQRFDFIARSVQASSWARKFDALAGGAKAGEIERIEAELQQQLANLEGTWFAVQQANEPTVLSAGDFGKVETIGRNVYYGLDGTPQTWLTDAEIASLSVKRGSLTSNEFDEIRGHVSHTFRFLSRIPWGRTFAKVPLIAGAHHERLNGTGYPNQLVSEQIPLQSKMMSIADIFDALTASDRPYKRAVPTAKAIDILGFEVKDGHLDAELVQLFVDAKPWEQLSGQESNG